MITRRSLPAALGLSAPLVFERTGTGGSKLWARTELYFGTNRAGAPPVTDDEFARFVGRYATRRFPGGLTLRTTYGQFLNSRGELVREKSFLLIVFYPHSMRGANERIDAIRDRYKREFQQESVLRVDSSSLVSF